MCFGTERLNQVSCEIEGWRGSSFTNWEGIMSGGVDGKKKDAAVCFAENVTKTTFSDLSETIVEATKKSILDTVGVMVAASGTTASLRQMAELVKEIGGKKESTIFGFGDQVPAMFAALTNGSMTHCLDYDDMHYAAFLHPGGTAVPSAIALAEKIGNVNGQELITAVALGQDVAIRMALAADTRWKMIWMYTPLMGTFGSTAASGKLLGLDNQQMVNAFGIAFCQAASTLETRYSLGNDMGGMRDGFPAQAGILSALMAQRGITGPINSLEGRAGLYPVYFAGEYKRDLLLSDLGKRFEGMSTGFKFWASCATTHVYIGALLDLIAEHRIATEDIEEIMVWVGDHARGLCEPQENRRKPANGIDARFSIPFVLAVAAVKGRVKIADFTEDSLADIAVLTMARKVRYTFDPDYNILATGEPPGKVRITTTTGKELSKRLDIPYGDPRNPISKDRLLEKFRECLSYSARPMSAENTKKAVELLDGLENVKDIRMLTELFR